MIRLDYSPFNQLSSLKIQNIPYFAMLSAVGTSFQHPRKFPIIFVNIGYFVHEIHQQRSSHIYCLINELLELKGVPKGRSLTVLVYHDHEIWLFHSICRWRRCRLNFLFRQMGSDLQKGPGILHTLSSKVVLFADHFPNGMCKRREI